jgi:predicted MFS family arabinose efflux permease
MGWYGVSFSLAFIIGPLLGARVYSRVSPLALWAGCGGLGIILALGFSMLERRRTAG